MFLQMLNFFDPNKNGTTDILFAGVDTEFNLYYSTDLLYYGTLAISQSFKRLKWQPAFSNKKFESLNCSSHKVMVNGIETIHCYARRLSTPLIYVFNVSSTWTGAMRTVNFLFHAAYEIPHNFTAEKLDLVAGRILIVGGVLKTNRQRLPLHLFYELRDSVPGHNPDDAYGVSASLLKTYSMEHYYGQPNSMLGRNHKPETLIEQEQELVAVSFEVTFEHNQSTERLLILSSDGTVNTANVYLLRQKPQLVLANHLNGTKLDRANLSKLLSEYQLSINFEHFVDLVTPPAEPAADTTLLRAALIFGIICAAIFLGTCLVYLKVKRDRNYQDDRPSAVHRETADTFYAAWPQDIVPKD